MSRLHFLVPCDPRRRSWGSGSQTAAAGERADIKQSLNDDDDDRNCDDNDDNDDDGGGGGGWLTAGERAARY